MNSCANRKQLTSENCDRNIALMCDLTKILGLKNREVIDLIWVYVPIMTRHSSQKIERAHDYR